MDLLRARVRAKENAGEDEVAKEIRETQNRLGVCENAMALQPIVAQLFAKSEPMKTRKLFAKSKAVVSAESRAKPAASTSEAEVVSAASSQTFAMQAMNRLDADKARVALAHLAACAEDWFIMEDGVFNVGAKFLRRRPGGASANTMTKLRGECSALNRKLTELANLANTAKPSEATESSEPACTGADRDVPEAPPVAVSSGGADVPQQTRSPDVSSASLQSAVTVVAAKAKAGRRQPAKKSTPSKKR
jgi:hypothetical protein